ncbi:hypothetical protein AwWohl_06000 [Gammaproteobacteria bacterium]|nr:hypothetical protein AwWohl_06000 [Gammaproteobacteria bacterium]
MESKCSCGLLINEPTISLSIYIKTDINLIINNVTTQQLNKPSPPNIPLYTQEEEQVPLAKGGFRGVIKWSGI